MAAIKDAGYLPMADVTTPHSPKPSARHATSTTDSVARRRNMNVRLATS